MLYAVTRQFKENGERVVEVAIGGLGAASPEMAIPWFDGEGKEYCTAREAVKAAIRVAEQWAGVLGHPVPICAGVLRREFVHYVQSEEVERLLEWAEREDSNRGAVPGEAGSERRS